MLTKEKTTTIVFIEDNETDRYTFGRYLQASGAYTIHAAPDAETALSLLQRVQPDCVLLDLKLPDRSGYEVLEELVETKRVTCPIIVLSVLSDKVYEEGALSLGAARFLVKSKTTAAVLSHAISAALRRDSQSN